MADTAAFRGKEKYNEHSTEDFIDNGNSLHGCRRRDSSCFCFFYKINTIYSDTLDFCGAGCFICLRSSFYCQAEEKNFKTREKISGKNIWICEQYFIYGERLLYTEYKGSLF